MGNSARGTQGESTQRAGVVGLSGPPVVEKVSDRQPQLGVLVQVHHNLQCPHTNKRTLRPKAALACERPTITRKRRPAPTVMFGSQVSRTRSADRQTWPSAAKPQKRKAAPHTATQCCSNGAVHLSADGCSGFGGTTSAHLVTDGDRTADQLDRLVVRAVLGRNVAGWFAIDRSIA